MILHIQFYIDKRHLFYKNTFFSTALKFQTPRTVSNGNHFLHIYSCCVEDKKCMVVISGILDHHLYWVYHSNIYIYINNILKSKCLDYNCYLDLKDLLYLICYWVHLYTALLRHAVAYTSNVICT